MAQNTTENTKAFIFQGNSVDVKKNDNTRYSDDSALFHFTSAPDDVASRQYHDYCLHVFCTAGSAQVRIAEKVLSLTTCSCMILLNNSTFEWISTSPDFRIKCLFISNKYLTTNTPDTNYQTLGTLAIMDDPILRMSQSEFDLCLNVCESIRNRISQHYHLFYQGVLRRCVETLMLDIYNIHAHNGDMARGNGNQPMRLFREFISLLEHGEFKREREVRWYASKLGITPKYLSEICINSSGHGASHWINRFTTEEIARLLHNPTMSINSIADLLNFNTRSYFSHYVKERLGMTPKDYRLTVLGVK